MPGDYWIKSVQPLKGKLIPTTRKQRACTALYATFAPISSGRPRDARESVVAKTSEKHLETYRRLTVEELPSMS